MKHVTLISIDAVATLKGHILFKAYFHVYILIFGCRTCLCIVHDCGASFPPRLILVPVSLKIHDRRVHSALIGRLSQA